MAELSELSELSVWPLTLTGEQVYLPRSVAKTETAGEPSAGWILPQKAVSKTLCFPSGS